ncbi:MAG: HPr-rel-A system PqqD family peptide chaperone [Polyangiaceae bacterium]|nr:HPr-rel-A system PqqD family peptide chaperone [Polyangiaceae bacterium]
MSRFSKFSKNVVFRREGDEALLFLPETGEVKLLNETGTLIWQLLEQSKDRDAIVHSLTDAFDVSDRQTLEADVDGFLDQMRNAGLIAPPEREEILR